MSGGSAPASPDYVGAAQATSQGNLAALQYQTQANRVNQVGPYGSSTWSSTPNQQAYEDALTSWYQQGQKGAAPTPDQYANWTQTTSLTPDEQAAVDAQQKVQADQSKLAQGLEGNVQSTMSQPFSSPSLSSYMSGVPSVDTNFTGFNSSGMPGVDTTEYNPSSYLSGVPGVNTSAPQFSDATAQQGAKAAYDAQMGLLQPQLDEQRTSTQNQLALQGLTPGTQAYDNAMRDLNNSQSSQVDQILNQSVLTGNQEANQNYASALEGYKAGNEAQGQAFGEGLNTLGANISAQQAANTAQGQDYSQALNDYFTGQQAKENANQAQGQAFGQGQQGYETAYQAALNNYYQPLNSLDAVLNGTQVQNPQFPNYFEQGYAPGTDYSTAANEQGAYNSNVYAADQQAAAGNMQAGVGLAGTALMAAAFF